MNYSLHPGAEGDLDEAADYYQQQDERALVEEFFEAFAQAVDRLLIFPALGSPWHGGTRRLPLDRFPYALIYGVRGEEIRIFAVAHFRRRPDYWHQRLS